MDEDRLQAARKVIGEVDRDMARLFMKRMEAVRDIAAYKREHALPVLDASRERQRVEAAEALVSPDLRPYVARLMEAIMGLSRDRQEELLRQDPTEVERP